MNPRPWLLLLAAGCSACVSSALDSRADAPMIVRLDAPAIEPSAAALPAALTVARPRAPSSLSTDRVAVRQPNHGFDYFAGLRWLEPAPEMLQRLLVTAIARDGRFAATFAAPARVPTDYLLDLEIRHFEAEYSAPESAPAVLLEAQVAVIAVRSGERVLSFLLRAREQAATNRRSEIVAAFDRAAGRLVADTLTQLRSFEPARVASGGVQQVEPTLELRQVAEHDAAGG